MAKIGTIAFSAGGRRMPAWMVAKPPYDVPYMPTAPVHQSCAASQAITSHMSSVSMARYSAAAMPSDVPVPRMSTRQTA